MQDWQDARNGEFFVLGSRDETSGCQLCVASIADDSTLTLRLRMPDCLAEQHGKYLVIEGVRFAYGHEQVLAGLQSNAEYVAYRREHGDKAARATALGQAISYRFKRDGKGWRVFVSTEMMDVPVVTDQRRGAACVDLNAEHLAVADTDASCNCLKAWRVPLVTYGKSRSCIGVGKTHGVYRSSSRPWLLICRRSSFSLHCLAPKNDGHPTAASRTAVLILSGMAPLKRTLSPDRPDLQRQRRLTSRPSYIP